MNPFSRKKKKKPPLKIPISLPPKINIQGGFSVSPLASLQPYQIKTWTDVDEDIAKNKTIEA